MKGLRPAGFTVLQLLLTLFGTAVLAVFIFFPVFASRCGKSPTQSCQSNLKQLGLSIMQYTQDYDEHYPLRKGNEVSSGEPTDSSWADALFPYYKNASLLQCPNGQQGASPANVRVWRLVYSDYWLNGHLLGRALEKSDSPAELLMMGDGSEISPASNARHHLYRLPDAWLTDEQSPLWRHRGGANYAFADGHVKWFKPETAARFAMKLKQQQKTARQK